MEKLFYSCPSLDIFKTLKFASDFTNTDYYTYENNDIPVFGNPDIKWNQICFVFDEENPLLYINNKIYYLSYNNLSQLQSNWNENDNTNLSYILNKPDLSQFITSIKTINNQSLIGTGNITISTGEGGGTVVQSDWAENDSTQLSYIANKPDLSQISGSLSNEYQMSSYSNYELEPIAGDTFEEAIGKLHKAVLDNEEIAAYAITNLDYRVSQISYQSDWNETNPSYFSYIINKPDLSQFLTEHQNIKTINSQSIIGTGNIDIVSGVQSNWNENDTTSLSYILNKPEIPVQVQANWNENNENSLSYIANKPDLSQISGSLSNDYEMSSYTDSQLNPESGDTFEEAISKLHKYVTDNQYDTNLAIYDINSKLDNIYYQQSDWNQTNRSYYSYILNKPDLSKYITSVKTINGQSLLGVGNITLNSGVQSNWNENDTSSLSYILNKPTIPNAQVQADWNQTNKNNISYIKNKPTIPDAQIQSNWNETNTSSLSYILNKPDLSSFITSIKTINSQSIIGTGNIDIVSGVKSDWSEDDSTQLSYIENKPDLSQFLTEHQSIKTINGQSLIGGGNIVISGGEGGGTVVQSDWGENDSTQLSYIANKPEILQYIYFNGVTSTIQDNTAYIVSNLDKIPLVTSTPSGSITLDPYKVYSLGTITSLTVSFDTTKEISGYVAEYCFRFVAGSNCSITLPNGCLYNGGSTPEYSAGRTYEININDNLVVVGEFY